LDKGSYKTLNKKKSHQTEGGRKRLGLEIEDAGDLTTKVLNRKVLTSSPPYLERRTESSGNERRELERREKAVLGGKVGS